MPIIAPAPAPVFATKISVSLTAAQRDKVRAEADRTGETMADVIRRMIDRA